MYGVNAPEGLQPLRYFNGAAWNDQVTPYQLLSGYNTNLFRGDPVTASAAVNGTVTIATAGDGNTILGVFWGVQYIDTNGVVQFAKNWTAGTVTMNAQTATVFVIDDPMVVFNIQGDGNGGGIATASLLRNASLIAGNGSNYSDVSGWMLAQATIGNAANKQLKIIRFTQAIEGNNLPAVQFNNVEVVINNHYYKAGVASV